jgi:hypothetical protein
MTYEMVIYKYHSPVDPYSFGSIIDLDGYNRKDFGYEPWYRVDPAPCFQISHLDDHPIVSCHR